MRTTRYALAASFGLTLVSAGAQAQPAADFYKGKNINLIISSSAGGGYDTLSRTIARHLPKHIPGAPVVAARNMPGAGGIIATKHLYTIAPKDGLTIGGVQNNTPFEPLLGTKEADYDPRRFNWLGSPSFETALLIVWHTAPVSTIDELRKREITIASSGANSTPSFFTRLLNELLGTKMRIIVGYPGQNESFAAMERGEVDGYSSIFWSSLTATKPDWIRDGKIKSIVQYGPEREAAVGAGPSVSEFLTKEEDKVLLEAAIAPLALGRPFLLPPDVPADRVKLMQDAFAATFADKEFLADADRLKLGVNVPRSAAEVKAIVEKAYATPQPIVARLQKIAQP
ncbi:MAG: tripartite tricarboxylate transporter substrate-binding protein [Beijerinckiaceae bacterium]|nr:tripartite tricarboxylate transporter substrate-binding protein [Beijerinckiaceae bacterium]